MPGRSKKPDDGQLVQKTPDVDNEPAVLRLIYKTQEQVMAAGGEQTPFLFFPLFEQVGLVRHGFSTRLGGVSTGVYASMNLGFGRGDDPAVVEENFRRIGAALGVSCADMVTAKQTHTVNIRRVFREDAGKGVVRPADYTDVDGLVTDEPGICLVTSHADCVPLYFLDPVKKAIGLSHSGWRGTAGRIGERTVKRMQQEFGSRPEDILAAVGPSICADCYEVSADVEEAFEKSFFAEDMARIFTAKAGGKYQLDLWAANRIILEQSGILPEHLAVTNVCTRCNAKMLYSHRAMGNARGSLCAFLALNRQALTE